MAKATLVWLDKHYSHCCLTILKADYMLKPTACIYPPIYNIDNIRCAKDVNSSRN
jgi:hypothetical protein